MATDDYRTPYRSAAIAFCELVEGIPRDRWASPALGEWNVRGLVGHTSRALSTVEEYLVAPVAGGRVLTDAVEYFVDMLPETDDEDARVRRHAGIAERGRKAGEDLGEHPATVVRQLADRVLALVDVTPDNALLATPAGPMTFSGYLPTRTFELTVHGLDLSRALHVTAPPALSIGVALSCELAGRLAARRRDAADFLMMLTGRSGLPGGPSVL